MGNIVKELFEDTFGRPQAALLTSYSWRRVASALAATCRSSVEQVNHFGRWAGVCGRADARQLKRSMAHRYCGRRAELEWQAKCEHWHCRCCYVALLLAKLPGSCLLRLPPPLPLLMALCFWSPLVRGLWPLRPPVSPKSPEQHSSCAEAGRHRSHPFRNAAGQAAAAARSAGEAPPQTGQGH